MYFVDEASNEHVNVNEVYPSFLSYTYSQGLVRGLSLDVEIIFMFPWAIDFKVLGWFGFVEMILFIVILTIGFIYAWKKGALEWHSIK